MDLNKFSKRAYKCALKRGKIHDGYEGTNLHGETVLSISDEFQEFTNASETEVSEHLTEYTEAVEELVDIAIVTFTELYRRGIDIEEVLHKKMKYNERR